MSRPPRGGVDRNTRSGDVLTFTARVAPLAGAWIETTVKGSDPHHLVVAPLAGAWIETVTRSEREPKCASPPSRGRGSKPFAVAFFRPALLVAPLAGAWIETIGWKELTMKPTRRPPRGGVDRNLQPLALFGFRGGRPPRGGVDRNVSVGPQPVGPLVAPLAGAWIETTSMNGGRSCLTVAPLAGAWIETGNISLTTTATGGRPPRGGVDRNDTIRTHVGKRHVSPPSRGRGSKLHDFVDAVKLSLSPP